MSTTSIKEQLAAISNGNSPQPVQPSSLWEIVEVRPFSQNELNYVKEVVVIEDEFHTSKLFARVYFNNDTVYPKPIMFEKTSVVTVGESVPLDELYFVHIRYNGDDAKIAKDSFKFRRIKKFSFDNPFGLPETTK